jgi:hypothetical protein
MDYNNSQLLQFKFKSQFNSNKYEIKKKTN